MGRPFESVALPRLACRLASVEGRRAARSRSRSVPARVCVVGCARRLGFAHGAGERATRARAMPSVFALGSHRSPSARLAMPSVRPSLRYRDDTRGTRAKSIKQPTAPQRKRRAVAGAPLKATSGSWGYQTARELRGLIANPNRFASASRSARTLASGPLPRRATTTPRGSRVRSSVASPSMHRHACSPTMKARGIGRA